MMVIEPLYPLYDMIFSPVVLLPNYAAVLILSAVLTVIILGLNRVLVNNGQFVLDTFEGYKGFPGIYPSGENLAEILKDFGFEVTELNARFRVNIFRQERGISVAIRYISLIPPTLADLKAPKIFYDLCNINHGLILVTGPTGSGKSTTLAAMIDYINCTQSSHILTIEDPIEFLFRDNKSIIRQRELGYDTKLFYTALVHALRHDPDVILVGEIRDVETAEIAIQSALTGHLVFSTLHTNDAASAVTRLVDMGNTVIVIEHNLEVVKCADYIIDLGPGGGRERRPDRLLRQPRRGSRP
jgi:ABC-type lipoprotein export system ATPase subunit